MCSSDLIADGDSPRTRSCPSESAACRRNAFVVSGDTVLVDEVAGAYACATFVSPRAATTSGWLPAAALDIKAAPPPKLQDWAGKWKRVEAEITLKVRGQEIEAEGEATWGSGDPNRVRNGAVHSGGFDGKARPKGNMLAFGNG